MKYFFATVIVLFYTIGSNYAQYELVNKTWKVLEFSRIFMGNKISLFNKDSSINLFDYSTVEMKFFADGTYTGTNAPNSNRTSGKWSLNSKRDSAVIDNTRYLVVKLDSTGFITRGYSLQLADTTGKLDTSFTYFKLYPVSLTLPVTISSFTGQFSGKIVELNWSTAQEINNKQFDVEASHDGVNFEKIGTVPGSGNSSLPLEYTFDDLHFFKTGKNFYRLKQIDLDGNHKFSSIVLVTVDVEKRSSVSVYPNPATDKIILKIGQPSGRKFTLQLTDITGRKLWLKTLASNQNSIEVSLPQLSKGVYLVSVTDDKGEKLVTDKLVIQ
jgi:hypothetical protein